MYGGGLSTKVSPLKLASTGVRNHMKGGGGNVPFLVTGAEDFVKEERPSPGQRA